MPFINTKTNVKISKEKETILKERLGKAIEIIPGKSENWLMLNFEDNNKMYFRGDDSNNIAFIEVKIYGASTSDTYDKLTNAISTIIGEELDINLDHIYVKYEECEYWGWNGNNF